MSYTFLDHTADLGIEVAAPSLDQLFAEALAGLTDCLTERSAVRGVQERAVEVEGRDLELLLVTWLDPAGPGRGRAARREPPSAQGADQGGHLPSSAGGADRRRLARARHLRYLSAARGVPGRCRRLRVVSRRRSLEEDDRERERRTR